MDEHEPHDIDAITQVRVGHTLKGKWRLERLLGRGGMAAVYAARHRNGSRVAIKVLHPELSVHPTIRTRFLREGYAANAVEHRGTVRVLDDDTDEDGAVFLVMELLEGEPLDVLRKRAGGTLSVADVLSIVDQLLDVLAAAHDKGIIHRDIKPQNLFLTTEGVLKVLDFGIAHLRGPSSGGTAMTKTGMGMGSPGYMSPEQARGRWKLVDAQSDLWAVGATMFRLLTGRPVHSAPVMNEALLLAMTATAPLIGTFLPEVSPEVAVIVDRALAFDKAARWPNARAMQAAVRNAIHALSAGALGASRDSQAPLAVAAPGGPAGGPPPPAELDVTGLKTTQKLLRAQVPAPSIAADAPEPPGTVSGVVGAAIEIAPAKKRVPSRSLALAAGALSLLVGALVVAKALQGDVAEGGGEPGPQRSATSAGLAPTPTARGEATGTSAVLAGTTGEPGVAATQPAGNAGVPATGQPQSGVAPRLNVGAVPPAAPSSSPAASSAASSAPAPSAAPSNAGSDSVPALTAAPSDATPGPSGGSDKAADKPAAPSTTASPASASPPMPPKSTGAPATPSPKPTQDSKDKFE